MRSGLPVVQLDAVVHRYPAFTVGPVDLAVPGGCVHALLGPNGSGKTTLLEVVCGLRSAHSGTALVEGRAIDPDDPSHYLRLGYVPDDEATVPLELTGPELWDVCAVLHGRLSGRAAAYRAHADRLADALSLEAPGRPMAEYSHGMRAKSRVVAALLHDPHLVVLDEPTSGLDPVAGHQLGLVLRGAATAGGTVLVATHDLAWAQRFADRASLLVAGRIVATGEIETVLGPVGGSALLDRFVESVQR